MNVDVKSKADNKVLNRKEIVAEISFSGATPNRADLRQALATKLGLNPDLMVLREVNNTYGRQAVGVVAHAYSDLETLKDTEPEFIRKRDSVGVEKKEEPKAEEKPAEAPKEEAKAEEKSEEKPKEEKPKEEKKEPPKEETKKEEKKEEPKPAEEKKEEKPKEEKKAEEKPEEKKE